MFLYKQDLFTFVFQVCCMLLHKFDFIMAIIFALMSDVAIISCLMLHTRTSLCVEYWNTFQIKQCKMPRV